MKSEKTHTGEGASWLGWQETSAALEVFQTVVDEVITRLSNCKEADPVCDWIDELTPFLEDYQERLSNSEDSLADALEAIKALAEEAESFAEIMRGLDDAEEEMEVLYEGCDDEDVDTSDAKAKRGGKPVVWDHNDDTESEDVGSPKPTTKKAGTAFDWDDKDEVKKEAIADGVDNIPQEIERLRTSGWHFYHVMLQSF